MRGNYQKRLSRFLVRSTDKCVFTASKPRTARIYVGHLLEPRVLDTQRTTAIYTTYDVLCIRLTIAGHCVLITGTARPADLVHSTRCVTSSTLLHSCVHCWPYDPSVSQQWECRELWVNFLFFVHCWWINESLLVVLQWQKMGSTVYNKYYVSSTFTVLVYLITPLTYQTYSAD